MPSFHIDGNWVDLASIGTATVFALLKHKILGRSKLITKRTAYDFATGTSLFPMLMLALSVISSDVLQSLLESNKLTLSVAGFIALFSILEDEFEKDQPPPRRGRKPKSTQPTP